MFQFVLSRNAPHLTSPEPLRRAAASGASGTASADGLYSGTASAGEESRRNVRGRGAGLELDDSAFSPASRESLFEGLCLKSYGCCYRAVSYTHLTLPTSSYV